MAKYLNEAGLALYDAKVKERLGKKADADAVPTKMSQLANDAGYITGTDVPEGAPARARRRPSPGATTLTPPTPPAWGPPGTAPR